MTNSSLICYKLFNLKTMRYALFFLIVLALPLLRISQPVARGIDTAPDVGKYAPEFNLNNINGKKVALSDLRGKVVLLNFWATWCRPCRAEMPSLGNLHTALKDRGFTVIAISVDASDRPVKSFVLEKGISFPVLMDKDKEVAFDQYGVFGLPTSFLIDRKGVVVEKFMGERDWTSSDIKNKIRKAMEGR